MNNTGNSTRFRQKPHKFRRFEKHHRGSTKVIAVSLAFVMVLSMLGANISSIVNLLEAYAKVIKEGSNIYYSTTIDLYDYYTDNEIKNGLGHDNNANDGQNRNSIFNSALYESGYTAGAEGGGHSWSTGNMYYIPLYLGLQYPGQRSGMGNQMLQYPDEYLYSMTANSESGSSEFGLKKSAADPDLVDSELFAGDLTQGNGRVILPYFDTEFLEAPLSAVLSPGSVPSSKKLNSVGAYKGQHEFLFKKVTNTSDPDCGYYRYDSQSGVDSLGYTKLKDASGTTPEIGKFKVGTGDQKGDLKGGKGFFPLVTQKPGLGQNYGYGAKFTIDFTMSDNGKTVPRNPDTGEYDPTQSSLPIKFKFSGDDDVWVFIDDQLVLDVGGAHGRVEGEISFDKTNPYAQTKYVKDGSDYNHTNRVGAKAGTSVNMLSTFNSLGLYSDSSKQHTLTVYYLERGSLESNCRITFNFQISDMITVKNTLSTRNVNSALTEITEQVANTEAVEYVMASNSPTSQLSSPEAGEGKDPELIQPEEANYYYVSYDTRSWNGSGWDTHTSIPQKKVKAGGSMILSKAYKVSYPGYYIDGWSTTEQQVKPEDQTATGITGQFTPSGNVTMHAVWKKQPVSPLEPPTPPILLYVNADHPADHTLFVSGKDKSYLNHGPLHISDAPSHTGMVTIEGSDYWGQGKDYRDGGGSDAQLGRFVNLTKNMQPRKADGTGGIQVWAKVRIWSEEGSNHNNNQHPKGDLIAKWYGDNKKADFTNNVLVKDENNNDITDQYVWRDGTTLRFYNEGYYVWDIYSAYSVLNRYDSTNYSSAPACDYVLTPGQNGNQDYKISDWISGYYALYQSLYVWWNANKESEDPVKRDAYISAVEEYKALQPKGEKTPGEVDEEFENNCNHTIAYVYDTDTVTFYLYAHSQPSVSSNNNYDPISGGTNGQEYTVSAYTPQGTPSLPTGETSGGSYYAVTVPKYVIKNDTDETTHTTVPTNMSNNLRIKVGDDEKFIDASEMLIDPPPVDSENNPLYPNEPCFYFNTEAKKHIGDNTSYSFSNYKVLWFFGKTEAPTVKITTIKGEETLELHQDGNLPYYYAKIPTTSSKTVGTTTTNHTTTYTIGSETPTAFSLPASSMTAPCLFMVGSTPTWYNLLTLVVEPIGNNWNWDSSIRLYVYDAGPMVCSWNDSYYLESSDGRYYIHTPSVSGSHYILRDNSSHQYPGNNEGYICDNLNGSNGVFDNVNNSSSDKYFANFTQANQATYEPYTAEYKTTQALSNLPNRSRRLTPQATIPEDESSTDSETGTPETGTPETGTPETGTPETGAPETGTPETGTPEAGSPEGAEGTDGTPVSGTSGDGNGQFVGSNNGAGGNYTEAGGTGFKLFDPIFSEVTNGNQDYARRRTDANGNYNLMFGQSARFTYQFNRKTGIKIAQTGNSFRFDEDTRKTAATSNAVKTGSNKTPIFSTVDSTNAADPNPPAFYQRYSTTYVVSDEAQTNTLTGVGPNAVNGTLSNETLHGEGVFSASPALQPYLTIQNVDGSSPSDDGIHLMVEYTNEVRTGDIIIDKQLTPEAIALCAAKLEGQDHEDTSFYFRVTLDDIFGGSTDELEYDGKYEIVEVDTVTNGRTTYKLMENSSPKNVQQITVNQEQISNVVEVTFSELYEKKNGAYQRTKLRLRVAGVPVYTKYKVEEIVPSDATYILKDITFTDFTAEDETLINAETHQPVFHTITNAATYARPWENGTHYESSGATRDGYTSREVDMENGVLAYGYRVISNSGQNEVTVTNDAESSYLIITKKIDKFYYHTQQGTPTTDDPAGLISRGGTVGGGISDPVKDYNGYQNATKAEQAFLFKIDICSKSEPMFGIYGGTTYTSYAPTYNNGSFMEYISFGPNDFAAGITEKSVILKVDPSCSYVVQELTDWSWKYYLNRVSISEEGTMTGTGPNGFNLVRDNQYAQAETFNKSFTVFNSQLGNSVTVKNAARVTFENKRYSGDDPRKDVEGDTTVADNSCTVPKHEPVKEENLPQE